MTPRWARSLQHVLVLALVLDVVGQLVGLVGDGSRDFLAATALAAVLTPIGAWVLRRREASTPVALVRG